MRSIRSRSAALHHAARALRAKTVLTLVKAGADVKLANGARKLPADFAAVSNGRDVFARDIRAHLENAKSIRKQALAEIEAAAATKREAKRRKSQPKSEL